MKALVSRFTDEPRWETFADPKPGPNDYLIDVSAVAITNLVKGQSNGSHYSVKGDSVPFVPGGDGVGRLRTGQRVYFFSTVKPFGSMAEQTLAREGHCIPLSDDIDDVTAASIANPAMSSWAALTQRARIQVGETVLINGATGVSGRMAIRIAKHLGAGRVIATGRKQSHPERMIEDGADEVLLLDEDFDAKIDSKIKDVSLVLDYLWGDSAVRLMTAAGKTHSDRTIRYVQIGSIAGATIPMPASALRASGLTLMGSGLGSVRDETLLELIGDAFRVANKIGLQVDVEQVPMTEAERVWNQPSSERVVLTLPKL